MKEEEGESTTYNSHSHTLGPTDVITRASASRNFYGWDLEGGGRRGVRHRENIKE